PKLKIEEGAICGECQIGKQTKVAHLRLQHQVTSRALELLHMDLMGPMQTKSLGGKKFAFVMVDDFSRFTWIDFLMENQIALKPLETCAYNFREKKRLSL
ncbi:putative gag-pol polyprotein, partial [Trifolium medium]|nr:putative gag-pol polyprotein [Trifolium medium]